MTRAELHDDLARLETLVDEYALAADLDQKRAAVLAEDIPVAGPGAAARCRCECDAGYPNQRRVGARSMLISAILKEMQIRDGLHVFGRVLADGQRNDLLVSIARLPRSDLKPQDASLHRALALDLGLGEFDPLTRDLAADFNGPRPAILLEISAAAWRTSGDVVERIEFACASTGFPARGRPIPPGSGPTRAGLDQSQTPFPSSTPAVLPRSAPFSAGWTAGFIQPGPSGAPTRGRPDVLPTGRNFFAGRCGGGCRRLRRGG